MKKYFALLAIGTFALTQTVTAQTSPKTATSTTKAGGTTTTKTGTTTNTTATPIGADGKAVGHRIDKGEKANKENKGWKEMKAFHKLMSSSFHPTEKGNVAPLRAKADSLHNAAVAWQASAVPATFKEAETKALLATLVNDTRNVLNAVNAKQDDATLIKLITTAHDTFHKIMGECRIDDGKGKGHDGDHKDHKDSDHKGDKR